MKYKSIDASKTARLHIGPRSFPFLIHPDKNADDPAERKADDGADRPDHSGLRP